MYIVDLNLKLILAEAGYETSGILTGEQQTTAALQDVHAVCVSVVHAVNSALSVWSLEITIST
jgi:hypothetical protein